MWAEFGLIHSANRPLQMQEVSRNFLPPLWVWGVSTEIDRSIISESLTSSLFKPVLVISCGRLLFFQHGSFHPVCASVRAADMIARLLCWRRRSGVAALERLLGRMNVKQEENKPQLQVSLSCQAGGKVHAAAVSTLTSPSSPVSNTLQPLRTGPDQLASFKEKEAELQECQTTKGMTPVTGLKLSPSLGGDGSVASLSPPMRRLASILTSCISS